MVMSLELDEDEERARQMLEEEFMEDWEGAEVVEMVEDSDVNF